MLLLAASLTLAACQSGADERDAVPTPAGPSIAETPRADGAPPPSAPSADAGRLISPNGIGEARVGMTVGALRAALPGGTTLGPAEPFMVDIAGLPVVHDADTLYYALVFSGEPAGEDTPLLSVATRSTAFRTAEGVGPGTTLTEAVAAHGAATLSYNTNDESREHAAFAGYPHRGVLFRVGAGGSGMAGTYATQGEYNETTTYAGDARILLVSVDLGGPVAD